MLACFDTGRIQLLWPERECTRMFRRLVFLFCFKFWSINNFEAVTQEEGAEAGL